MTEDDGMRIDLRRMFPEASRRVEILGELVRIWPSVVGMRVARWSRPAILGVKELTVEVRDSQAGGMLSKMTGNIERALGRLGYEAEGFAVKIVGNVRRERRTVKNVKREREIVADEGRIARYMEGEPETLPEDINRALAHLRAYLDGRNRDFHSV